MRKNWKNTDTEKLLHSLIITESRPITTTHDIDQEVGNLTEFIASVIEKSVSSKKVSQWLKEYWNQECSEAVKKARKAYYDWLRLDSAELYQLLQEVKREKKNYKKNKKNRILKRYKGGVK